MHLFAMIYSLLCMRYYLIFVFWYLPCIRCCRLCVIYSLFCSLQYLFIIHYSLSSTLYYVWLNLLCVYLWSFAHSYSCFIFCICFMYDYWCFNSLFIFIDCPLLTICSKSYVMCIKSNVWIIRLLCARLHSL